MVPAAGERFDVEPGGLVEIPEGTRWVQFTRSLTPEHHEQIAAWLGSHPGAGLRVYGNYRGEISNLEFLSHYKRLRVFDIDSMYGATPDLSGLRHLPSDLGQLHLGVESGDAGETLLGRCIAISDLTISEHKKLPENLAAQTSVRRLSLAGPFRGIEHTKRLVGTEELVLARQTLPELSAVTHMTLLSSFRLVLGGTKDLSQLSQFRDLAYLHVASVRGLADLATLSQLTSLEHLRLEEMRNVTNLPDMSRLSRLRKVELHTMKGLTDLAPVAAAPALEEFWLASAMHLQPEVVLPFVGHSTLRRARIGFGSKRKNQLAEQLLGLRG